ncbi:hypothetical protein BS636_06280 [Acinetobacter sp. LoGeW2-3]|uniref:hypothetical protein n=1 Tax=Acinetobacter sp. LoGeW2-3 TaxID=1808001 RepID=UPI000C05B3CD|nr:hypothetical protein [Acinetobacter sp. LoGeW2-3]ATO21017.1 hypothetical protein BS636_06280 [Acinetobacter sp. LoGeW2-3]
MKLKQIFQNSVLPFALFAGALSLLGCDEVSAPVSHTEKPVQQEVESEQVEQQETAEVRTSSANLKSGNMFYIVRDVADFQLKASDYVEQLKQTQTELETAVDSKDTAQLQAATTQLQQQLTGFNKTLGSLNLKSQEVDQVRSNIMTANQQALASPFLNGQMDFSKVDFKKLEQQMGNVQMEMLKLAAMMIPESSSEDSSES